MRVVLNEEANRRVKTALLELKYAGFIPNFNIELDELDITTFGGPREGLITAKARFEFIVPDSMLEIIKE